MDSQPVPWDFYITQQLTERLGEAFNSCLLEQSDCFLFQDGCFMVYKDTTHFTIQVNVRSKTFKNTKLWPKQVL